MVAILFIRPDFLRHTAKGQECVFVTLEDETGVCKLVVFKDVFQKFHKPIIAARLLMVEGKLEREGGVTHIIARRFDNVSSWLRVLTDERAADMPLLEPVALKAFPEAGSFH